jgi:hypothetical protein
MRKRAIISETKKVQHDRGAFFSTTRRQTVSTVHREECSHVLDESVKRRIVITVNIRVRTVPVFL